MMTRSQKRCALKTGVCTSRPNAVISGLSWRARQLTAIMHPMWLDGSESRFAASYEPARNRRAGGIEKDVVFMQAAPISTTR
jgi:hypothetical protein